MIASLIVILYLTGVISADSAVTSLYVAGALLIVAELGIVSFGAIALNGLIALYAAYAIQSGSALFLGIPLGWQVLFGIAIVEISVIATVITIHMRIRSIKNASGIESMIGDTAIVTQWSETTGSVRYNGEIWKACSSQPLDLKPDEKVTIEAVDKLVLTITKQGD